MNVKNFTILAIFTLLIVIATVVIVIQEQPSTSSPAESLVFPKLVAKINDVTEIEVATKDEHFTLVKGDKHWGLQEKHQYPTAMDKVSQLILGLAELKILEAKTANPDLYSKLGVEDITAEDAQSVLFTLKDNAGNPLASLIVGENQVSKIDATRREFYLRKAGDKQTWLAIGTLPIEKKSTQWLDKQVLDIDDARIRQVQVIYSDGKKITIFRDAKENEDYQLADLPAQMKIKSMYTLKQMAGALADLNMADVTVPSEIAFTPEASTQVVFTTFDGLEITMTLTAHEDKHYAKFTAVFVPEMVKTDPEVKTDSTEEKLTPEQVKTEADSLQEQLKAWVFEIPAYKATTLLKRQTDLVEAKPAEEVVDEVGNVSTSEPIDEMGQESTLPHFKLEDVLGQPVTVN